MRYKHPDGRILFVKDKNSLWGTFWESNFGSSRVKSEDMPMVDSQETAQANLDKWALQNGCTPVESYTNSIQIHNDGELEDKLTAIRSRTQNIMLNFLEIGGILMEIDEKKLFEQKGYKNVIEMSKREMNMSKTTLYNLINVAKKFSMSGKLIDKYKEYGFSQLVEMLSLPEGLNESVTPDMSVRDIQALKRTSENETTVQSMEVPDPIPEEKPQADNKELKLEQGLYECSKSKMAARMQFPNFKCFQCKEQEYCSEFKNQKEQIAAEMEYDKGVALENNSGADIQATSVSPEYEAKCKICASNNNNSCVKERPGYPNATFCSSFALKKEESKQDKDDSSKVNEKIVSLSRPLEKLLKECAVKGNVKLETKTREALENIFSYYDRLLAGDENE